MRKPNEKLLRTLKLLKGKGLKGVKIIGEYLPKKYTSPSYTIYTVSYKNKIYYWTGSKVRFILSLPITGGIICPKCKRVRRFEDFLTSSTRHCCGYCRSKENAVYTRNKCRTDPSYRERKIKESIKYVKENTITVGGTYFNKKYLTNNDKAFLMVYGLLNHKKTI